MNKQLLNNQNRVLRALSDSGSLFVKPGFPVEQRTIFGLGGEDSDLAISLEWRDAEDCKWVADFTEESLKSASVDRNQIALTDSEGVPVCLEFYDLKAGRI